LTFLRKGLQRPSNPAYRIGLKIDKEFFNSVLDKTVVISTSQFNEIDDIFKKYNTKIKESIATQAYAAAEADDAAAEADDAAVEADDDDDDDDAAADTAVQQKADSIRLLSEFTELQDRVLTVTKDACIGTLPTIGIDDINTTTASLRITTAFNTCLDYLITSLGTQEFVEERNKEICKEITKLFKKLKFDFIPTSTITPTTVFIMIQVHNSYSLFTPDCSALLLFNNFVNSLMTTINDDSNPVKVTTNTHPPLTLTLKMKRNNGSKYMNSLSKCTRVTLAITAGGRSHRKSNTTHRRKHNRKTHRKHARKTRHKRTHRSRAARKHKKYSRTH
jgi:hypothetical protein